MKKILVIQTASIGDVILATAILEKLHRFYPDTDLDLLVKQGMEPLFYRHPFIHRLLVWDKSNKYRNFFRLLREVRNEHYDLVINIQRFTLTGILTTLSGSKTTIGFDKNPLERFFTRSVPHEIGPGIHETDRNQALVAGLTDHKPEKPRLYPQQIPDTGCRILDKNVDQLSAGIGHPASGIYYTIAPASLWFTKQYPAEKWIELIWAIPEEATVYLLGSKADFELCEKIRVESQGSGVEGRRTREERRGKRVEENDPASGIGHPGSSNPVIQSSSHPNIKNLAGQLTLLESAAMMKGARMNFTNDSAPMHLASAVNAPVTVIYCSTTPDFGFGPLSDDSVTVEIQEKLSCRPCGLHGRASCPEHHFKCALAIDTGLLRSRL